MKENIDQDLRSDSILRRKVVNDVIYNFLVLVITT